MNVPGTIYPICIMLAFFAAAVALAKLKRLATSKNSFLLDWARDFAPN